MSAGGVRLSGRLTETYLHAQEVLQSLAQNRMGKDNAAIEFSRTSLLQRTWPRLRSVATLYIVALTLPISILGCVALVVMHILRGGRLTALSPHPISNTRKGYQPTAIVTGVHCHTKFATQSLRSNAALLVAPVSLTSRLVQHPRTAYKACRRSLGKLPYSADILLQQATALCTSWIILHGPIHCQHIT